MASFFNKKQLCCNFTTLIKLFLNIKGNTDYMLYKNFKK